MEYQKTQKQNRMASPQNVGSLAGMRYVQSEAQSKHLVIKEDYQIQNEEINNVRFVQGLHQSQNQLQTQSQNNDLHYYDKVITYLSGLNEQALKKINLKMNLETPGLAAGLKFKFPVKLELTERLTDSNYIQYIKSLTVSANSTQMALTLETTLYSGDEHFKAYILLMLFWEVFPFAYKDCWELSRDDWRTVWSSVKAAKPGKEMKGLQTKIKYKRTESLLGKRTSIAGQSVRSKYTAQQSTRTRDISRVQEKKKKYLFKMCYEIQKEIEDIYQAQNVIKFKDLFGEVLQDHRSSFEELLKEGLQNQVQCQSFDTDVEQIWSKLVAQYVEPPKYTVDSDDPNSVFNMAFRILKDKLLILCLLSYTDVSEHQAILTMMFVSPYIVMANKYSAIHRSNTLFYATNRQFNPKEFFKQQSKVMLPFMAVMEWFQYHFLTPEYPRVKTRPVLNREKKSFAAGLLLFGVSGSGKSSFINSVSKLVTLEYLLHQDQFGLSKFQSANIVGAHLLAIEEAGPGILDKNDVKALLDTQTGQLIDVKNKNAIIVGKGQPVIVSSNHSLSQLAIASSKNQSIFEPIVNRLTPVFFSSPVITQSDYNSEDHLSYMVAYLVMSPTNGNLREKLCERLGDNQLFQLLLVPYSRTLMFELQLAANMCQDSHGMTQMMFRDTALDYCIYSRDGPSLHYPDRHKDEVFLKGIMTREFARKKVEEFIEKIRMIRKVTGNTSGITVMDELIEIGEMSLYDILHETFVPHNCLNTQVAYLYSYVDFSDELGLSSDIRGEQLTPQQHYDNEDSVMQMMNTDQQKGTPSSPLNYKRTIEVDSVYLDIGLERHVEEDELVDKWFNEEKQVPSDFNLQGLDLSRDLARWQIKVNNLADKCNAYLVELSDKLQAAKERNDKEDSVIRFIKPFIVRGLNHFDLENFWDIEFKPKNFILETYIFIFYSELYEEREKIKSFHYPFSPSRKSYYNNMRVETTKALEIKRLQNKKEEMEELQRKRNELYELKEKQRMANVNVSALLGLQ